MIKLSNGRELNYVVASGALGFDCKGWFWERPLVWLDLIKPELFTVFTKSLTLNPVKGNLCWWKPWTWLPFSPWSCVRFLPGGAVNKVGLTNPGFLYWFDKIRTKMDFKKYSIGVSIFGEEPELVRMAKYLNLVEGIVAIEINVSCVNKPHDSRTAVIVSAVKAVKKVSLNPIIVKVGVDQDYLAIAEGVRGYAEAISLNSVLWKLVFPCKCDKSPVAHVGKVAGDGGVSGKPAQDLNWEAVSELSRQGALPVIAPSIMEYEDLEFVRRYRVGAVSFGTIHLRTPWKATQIAEKDILLENPLRKAAKMMDEVYKSRK